MRTLTPGTLRGEITAPPSKSHTLRLLLCAALGDRPVRVACLPLSADAEAAARCASGLGCTLFEEADALLVTPGDRPRGTLRLNCGESATLLRFLLPLCGALGLDALLETEGSLTGRTVSPLDALVCAHGMSVTRAPEGWRCAGTLRPGDYRITGTVSSQFISGLLFALPLLPGESRLTVTDTLLSSPYVAMTEDVLRRAGIRLRRRGLSWEIPGGQAFCLPEESAAERDWSGAAAFLCLGAFSRAGISVSGLSARTEQGDRRILEYLQTFGARTAWQGGRLTVRRETLRGCGIDASDCPDLVPALAALAASAEGETRIRGAARLRGKESDRLDSMAEAIRAVGGEAETLPDGLLIRGKALSGGTVDPRGDHRVAMAAAVLAAGAKGPVTVLDSGCVAKSFPDFWKQLEKLEAEA